MTESSQKSKVEKAEAVKSRPEQQEQLINLLSRKAVATTKQMLEAFGWQPHTARAARSKLPKAGISVERSDAQKGAVYHIVALV